MRPRIAETHKVSNGLFTTYVKAVKVTTSGNAESHKRFLARRAKQLSITRANLD